MFCFVLGFGDSGDITPCSPGSELEFECDTTGYPLCDNISDNQYSAGRHATLEVEDVGVEGEQQVGPVVTLASSFTGRSSIQRGFVVPDEKQNKS